LLRVSNVLFLCLSKKGLLQVPFIVSGSWKSDDRATVRLWIVKADSETENATLASQVWTLYNRSFGSLEKAFDLLLPFVGNTEIKSMVGPACARALSSFGDNNITNGLKRVFDLYRAHLPKTKDEEETEINVDTRTGAASILGKKEREEMEEKRFIISFNSFNVGASGKFLNAKTTKEVFQFLNTTFADEIESVRMAFLQAGLGMFK
jgi:hypothetical protein